MYFFLILFKSWYFDSLIRVWYAFYILSDENILISKIKTGPDDWAELKKKVIYLTFIFADDNL